jgi:hypothetical protein
MTFAAKVIIVYMLSVAFAALTVTCWDWIWEKQNGERTDA